MAIFSKEELKRERLKGLVLSDEDNESDAFITPSANLQNWTNEQFEVYLATRTWSEKNKDIHRNLFKGQICIENGTIAYD